MTRRTVRLALLALLVAAVSAPQAGSADRSSSAAGGTAQGVDLYSLSRSVERRGRDLDLMDLRLQEERKVLEMVKKTVRQQLTVLDGKLARLEALMEARRKDQEASRRYIARVFRSMKTDEAARVLQKMGKDRASRILRELKEKDAAKIMDRMDTGFAVEVAKRMGE